MIAPRLEPGPTAWHILLRNRLARGGLLASVALVLVGQPGGAELRATLAVLGGVGIAVFGVLVAWTMREFGRQEATERSFGYATLDRERNEDLWLLDPRTGRPICPPLGTLVPGA